MYINPCLKYEYYPGDLSNGLGEEKATRITREHTLLAIIRKLIRLHESSSSAQFSISGSASRASLLVCVSLVYTEQFLTVLKENIG